MSELLADLRRASQGYSPLAHRSLDDLLTAAERSVPDAFAAAQAAAIADGAPDSLDLLILIDGAERVAASLPRAAA